MFAPASELSDIQDQLDTIDHRLAALVPIRDHVALAATCEDLVHALALLRDSASHQPPNEHVNGYVAASLGWLWQRRLAYAALCEAERLANLARKDASSGHNYNASLIRARHSVFQARRCLDYLAPPYGQQQPPNGACRSMMNYALTGDARLIEPLQPTPDRSAAQRKAVHERELVNRWIVPRRWWQLWRR
jgi:hypothetical protein